jgi:hypothetical protein
LFSIGPRDAQRDKLKNLKDFIKNASRNRRRKSHGEIFFNERGVPSQPRMEGFAPAEKRGLRDDLSRRAEGFKEAKW